MGKRVILESPFNGPNIEEVIKNVEYAKACMKDCFNRGEYPFASHLIYTRLGVLDDKIPEERKLGIEAGLNWGQFAELTVVYTDRGVSEGMKLGIKRAEQEGRPIEYRTLDE